MASTINIDTGGTFTDGFFTHRGRSLSVKVFTTPHDVTVGMFECVEEGAARLGISISELLTDLQSFSFSSTMVTNALLERRGTAVGLLTSEGPEREAAEALVRSGFLRPELVHAVPAAPDQEALAGAIEALLDRGAQVLAVSLSGSSDDPAVERSTRLIVREAYPTHYLGSVRVFLASDISPLPEPAERTQTVVLNAFVHDLVWRATYGVEDRLRALGMRVPLMLVQSHGGLARTAKTLALQTYNSGPVAGALGTLGAMRADAGPQPLAFDVGGTSTDIALVHPKQLALRWQAELCDLDVHLPVVPVHSYATGGGTIAYAEEGALRLGPRSAGAHPGPACFNRGSDEATVTDANLLLGLLDPDSFHGGTFQLHRELAENALAKLGAALGREATEVAREVRELADEQMAVGVRKVLDEAGVAPQNACVVSYGGGGGLHAAAVAARVGVPQVLVPWSAAVFSAVGVSTLDLAHVYPLLLNDGTDDSAGLDLLEAARRDMLAEGERIEDGTVELQLVETGEGSQVRATTSWSGPPSEADFTTAWRAVVEGAAELKRPLGVLRVSRAATAVAAAGPEVAAEPRAEEIEVDWGNGPQVTARLVLEAAPAEGWAVSGPAVIAIPQTTVAVPPRWRASLQGTWLQLKEEDA